MNVLFDTCAVLPLARGDSLRRAILAVAYRIQAGRNLRVACSCLAGASVADAAAPLERAVTPR